VLQFGWQSLEASNVGIESELVRRRDCSKTFNVCQQTAYGTSVPAACSLLKSPVRLLLPDSSAQRTFTRARHLYIEGNIATPCCSSLSQCALVSSPTMFLGLL
jgi:hypothetical protein